MSKKKAKASSVVLGRLTITLHHAENLLCKDQNDLPNPYALISFNRQTRKSKVISKSTSPKWNEVFCFDIFDKNDSIVVSLYDRDRLSRDEILGHLSIPFSKIPPNEVASYKENLNIRGKSGMDVGNVQFDILFEKFNQAELSGSRMLSFQPSLGIDQFDSAFITKFQVDGDLLEDENEGN